jgi:hypothetical protein
MLHQCLEDEKMLHQCTEEQKMQEWEKISALRL